MTEHPLDGLIAAEQALIGALDRDDVGDVEGALGLFRAALGAVRATGGWHDAPETLTRLTHALQLAEAARARIAYLADRTARQLDRLATLGKGGVRGHAYGRNGRIRMA